MSIPRGLAAGLSLFLGINGCAGGQVYENGINHVYLCAVRAVRTHGYQVRQQEFKRRSGKMVAARSVPDPKETPMQRGFFRRVAEVVSNAVEHSKLEFWDQDLAAARIRTDERVVAKFKSRGFLGLGSRKRTRVKFAIDSTDYGREDWVIKRERLSAGGREGLYQALALCLGGKPEPARLEVAAKPASLAPKPKEPPSADKTVVKPSEPALIVAAKPPATVAPQLPPAAVPAPVRLTPEELEEKLEQGRKAYEAGNYGETVQLLEIAIQSDPRNPEALGYLGAANYQLGRYAQAIQMYERYLEIVPGDLRTEDFLKEIKRAQQAQ